MATNVYEGMFILDSNRYGRSPESVVTQIPKMIEDAGGEVLVSRLWEERRLAYPINGHRKGTYWLTYFRAPGKEITGLERKCQLSETILRALFLRVDPRLVDAMIAHAQAGPTTSAPPAEDDKRRKRDVVADVEDIEEVVVDAIEDVEVEE
ncbi:MAG TPA: 30S ribosomal protein S6 [Thermoguttaceae bacterium]|nr:30S ribosomal protein S6 [Thermoguttaceae bacterium]